MQNYQLGEVIGKGSYGKAYRARRRCDEVVCIIKSIDLRAMNREEARRVEQEARLLERLRHPQIVAHLETFMHRQNLCIVMEYCAGGDLEQWISRQRGRLPSRNKILALFSQICLALEHVHANRIIHRDLKSSNIFLQNDLSVKLGDFGVSTELQISGQLAATAIGTPVNMAPELLLEKPYDYKVDLWSTGCVLYELCRLKRAFQARNIASLVNIVLHGEPAELKRLSPEFKSLVSRLLSKNADLRPDITEVLALPCIAAAAKAFISVATHSTDATTAVSIQNDHDDTLNYVQLDNGWWKKRDPASGFWFYVHERTGHAQWEPPELEDETDRARRVRDAVRARVLAEREKRIRVSAAEAHRESTPPKSEVEISHIEASTYEDEKSSQDNDQTPIIPSTTSTVSSTTTFDEDDHDGHNTYSGMCHQEDAKDMVENEPEREMVNQADNKKQWLGDLEERMGQLRAQLQELPVQRQRKESKATAIAPQEKKDDISTSKKQPTKRELERAELRRRIAAGRAAVRSNASPEVEVAVPKLPPPPPPRRPKSCSLYEYLIQKQGTGTPLLKPSRQENEDDITTLLTKLQQKVEIQRDLTDHVEAIRRSVAEEDQSEQKQIDSDDEDLFLDCMTTLTRTKEDKAHFEGQHGDNDVNVEAPVATVVANASHPLDSLQQDQKQSLDFRDIPYLPLGDNTNTVPSSSLMSTP